MIIELYLTSDSVTHITSCAFSTGEARVPQ